MKTRDSPPPPPVHLHVLESTPVHVHMGRRPSKTPQSWDKGVQVKGDGGRPKVRKPWIPPGRLSCRRDVDSHKCQTSRVQRPSQRGIRHQREAEEQEEELDAVSKNLSSLLGEEESFRRLKKSDSWGQHRETDVLLRALVEAEIDGVAVANQLTALKETVDRFAKDKKQSKLRAGSLERQQKLLLEKVEMFDNTNHRLRQLLREWSKHERESLVWSEQKESLKKRLADSEAENMRLAAKLAHKEKEASKLAEHLDFEKDNVKTTKELSKILDSTRSHLESQLSRAEAEKARLEAQIKTMQQSQEQQQKELQVLQEELRTLREQKKAEQGRSDQAMLIKQAERAEESAGRLADKLQEKESQLTQALSTSSDWCLRHSKEAAAKEQLEEEVSALKIQVTELHSQLQSAAEKNRAEREELRDQLHHLSAENASTKLDNQRLKGELMSSEEKQRGLQSEARQLKASIRKSESLVEKYKKKVQQARLKSEEYCLKLEVVQKEAREVQVTLDREKEQVSQEMLGRLRELKTLSDRLRKTELQLRDAQEEADEQERKNMDNNAALSEVRHKVEQQGTQLEMLQQRNLLLQEENNILKEKVHKFERRLEDLKAENGEMSQAVASKEASIRSIQQQLEEKTEECSVLSRQMDDSIQRVSAKERSSQSKALDLQSQLSQTKIELSQLQRNKEEMHRRFQSQLQNMKERLEQSDSTNRSLQNYVHFLKTSYGNVFSNSLLAS